jgi:ElaB/YqjD/DUF883 family membrane-anchored ribosome-binding protein
MMKNIEKTRDTIDSLVDATADVATGVADFAENVAEKTADNFVGKAHEAGSFVRDKVGTTARGVHQQIDDAAEAIDGRYARARAQLSRAASATTSFASSNPGTALILAASVGFIFGFMTHRQHSPA